MKIKHFIPLLFYLLITILSYISFIPKNLLPVSGFVTLLLGLILTYFTGINETLKNGDVVIKIREKTPYSIPVALFVTPNLLFIGLNIKNSALVYLLISNLIAVIFAYFCGIGFILRELKSKAFRNSITEPEPRSRKKLLLINPVSPASRRAESQPIINFSPARFGDSRRFDTG